MMIKCSAAPVFTGRHFVLLSGGLDSVAALIWAKRRDTEAEAVFIDYGQPARAHERRAAHVAADACGAPLHVIDLSDVYAGTDAGIFTGRPSELVNGRDTAFLPCRNHLLVSSAAARAALRWPGTPVRLVVGFNWHDGMGFPDCSKHFVTTLQRSLDASFGCDGAFFIDAPWQAITKAEIVAWVRQNASEAVDLLRESWSCYRADGPCGQCTACRVRGDLL